MMFREFAASDRWWEGLWGGGHQPLRDPVSQGWRAYPVKGNKQVIVIGRKGQPLCASVVQMHVGLDVALYDECPEEVAKAVEQGRAGDLNPRYIQIDNYPGWGLSVIETLNPPWGCVVHVQGEGDPKPYAVSLTVRAAMGFQAGAIAEEITGGSLAFFCPASDMPQG